MSTKKLLKKTISLVITSVFLLGIVSIGFTSMAIDGPTNLALGKTVALSIGGGGTDNDPQKVLDTDGTIYTVAEVEQATISRLTDGVALNGSGDVFETNWVGGLWNSTGTRSKYVQFYRNLNRELTIDLGQMSNLNSLSMSFGTCATYGISLPISLSYYISQDGINYYLAGTVEKANAIPETVSCTGENPMAHSSFALTGLNYNAQYVKILFGKPVDELLSEDRLGNPGPESGHLFHFG